ncbi:1-acyl-sn-glycerol-3-phosphate acyltransferase [Polyangium aurulentum]|nr:1-acyl-sn-glycerol-3-phosphate acyltransferase [Polyangium aurulentum]
MPPSSAAPRSVPLMPGYDLDVEAALHVAPVGPTEPGATHPTMPPAGAPEDEETEAAAPPANPENLEEQIRALEARLDQMIGEGRERQAAATPPAVTPVPPKKSEPAPSPAPAEGAPDDATAREVLSTDFYARQWGRAGMRSRSEEVDEFGLDPTFEAKVLPALDFLYKYYFRVETEGAEHIPTDGRCLLVSNHSGGPLPYDGAMLRTAVRREHAAHRELRWLAEDFIYYLPFVGTFMNRLGAVRACQENAERLLGRGALVAVFPEGAKGIGKLFRDRYRLQRFGRGGFIRLCLRTRTPLVPCAIVGAEEANPMLYRFEYMTEALGIPYFPITPTFPALGPLGLLPAPTKWKIRFGEPMHWGNYGPEAADDEILVGRLSERVRATIQGMLDQMVSKRRSIWLG